MKLLGQPGVDNSTVYSKSNRSDWMSDAETLKFTVKHGKNGVMTALNSDNQITGEWEDNHGGMLAW